ncbi:MAG: hypothetical protein ACP5OS_06870 [Leptospirillia bacterium]
METKDAYKQKMNAQLKEWGAQINLLAAKAQNKGADANINYAKALGEIRRMEGDAAKKLRELDEASGETWKSVKGTTDKLLEDLKAGVVQALAKFK